MPIPPPTAGSPHPTHPSPPVTLRDWLPTGRVAVRSESVRKLLVASGISPVDLAAWQRAVGAQEGEPAAYALALDLLGLGQRFPDLTVRSALGWCLLVAHRSAPDPISANVSFEVTAWAERGLVEVGWLFEAAGIGPDEAGRVVRADDEAEWDAVRLLAGLSGVPQPS